MLVEKHSLAGPHSEMPRRLNHASAAEQAADSKAVKNQERPRAALIERIYKKAPKSFP